MTRFLVTGGLGFIGSHVVEQLLSSSDNHVTVVDNLSTNVLPVDMIVDDISGPGTLELKLSSIADYRADCDFKTIFHLASPVGPAGVLKVAGQIVRRIVDDTYKVAEIAFQRGARLVNVSTSEVYGGGLDGTCSETCPRVIRGPATARQEYAAGKLAAEVALQNLSQVHGLDVVSARPFNVAGVRQMGSGGFVLPRFLGQALAGIPLTVFGDGSQLRAFTDARDVASGILVAASKGTSGEIYNVGNPDTRVSISRLADLVLRVTCSRAGKTLVDPRTIYGSTYADAPDKFPDAGMLIEMGWEPQYAVIDTIKNTVGWLQQLTPELLSSVTGITACVDSAANAQSSA